MKNVVKSCLGHLFHLFFPRSCVVCGTLLAEGEEDICVRCNIDMPRTDYHRKEDNPVERMFWGKVFVERATSYFFYRKGSDFRRILHQLKYGGRKELGTVMGRFMAAELLPTGFFEGIDVMIPVPLHYRKQRIRGYNQSEWITRGVSRVTGIHVDTSLVIREKPTETQTRKSVYERWENVEGGFKLLRPDGLAGKHVLIIDDVLTTGATITACADVFREIEGIRISVLTMAVAEV
ncbi:ComF family protein [Bacteroides sp. UBA939]|uniref:ComF family protein n=1 Tax=Bacteroides sp. UBA939 TaxID=1946092 RepID=UPI0025B89F72|nr:ComF family protein [Bacteroides sp. UBA939]